MVGSLSTFIMTIKGKIKLLLSPHKRPKCMKTETFILIIIMHFVTSFKTREKCLKMIFGRYYM